MRLAFPAWRRGFFKATGGVITEALRRGHEVALIHGPAGKIGEEVTTREILARWPRAACAEPARVDAVLGPSLHAYEGRLPKGSRYALDLAWENLTVPVGFPGRVCWASAYQRTLWQRLHGRAAARQPGAITGSPMVDALAEVSGRPPGAPPQVVLMALKFPRNAGLWRRLWYRWIGYRRLVRAVRRCCDRLGAHLIVKTRAKNRDPAWLAPVADAVVLDHGLWPYTAAPLIASAALVIHFQSGAALEAASAGVPQVSLHVPHPHLAAWPGHHAVYEASPGMQDWPGVVPALGWESAVGYLDDLAVFPSVDPRARAVYVERFLGFDDHQSAARILDLVERGA